MIVLLTGAGTAHRCSRRRCLVHPCHGQTRQRLVVVMLFTENEPERRMKIDPKVSEKWPKRMKIEPTVNESGQTERIRPNRE